MAIKTLILLSDNLLKLDGLQNSDTLAYLNSATVTARVLKPDGTEVAGVSWPITLSHDGGTTGIYKGTLPDTMTLTAGWEVTIEITADAGAGLRRVVTIPAFVDN